MKRIKYILPLALFALTSTVAEAREYTLEECVNLAIENNVKMRDAELNVEASREMSKMAFTKYFPSISAAGMAFTSNHGILQHDFSIPFPIPDLGIPDFNFNLSFLKKGTVAGVNLLQPVFLGGRIVNGNKLSHVGEEVSRLQQRQTADEVRLNVEQYYWQLVSLNSKHQTVDAAINMLDTLTSQVQSYVDAGITTTNDLLEVKLKRNEMLSSRTELENGVSVIKMLLSQYIGQGVSGDIEVNEDVPLDSLPTFPYDIYRAPEDCLSQTVGYGLLTQNVKAKELQQRISLGNNLPIVAAGACYNYENLFEQGHTFANLYVTVSIPISDWWGGAHSMKKSKIESRIARNELEDNSQLLMIAMTNSWNDLNTAYSQLAIAKESIAQSAENLRLNENFYHAGTVTVTDLLNAQTLHRQSQDKYVEAYTKFQLKKLSYLQATGR